LRFGATWSLPATFPLVDRANCHPSYPQQLYVKSSGHWFEPRPFGTGRPWFQHRRAAAPNTARLFRDPPDLHLESHPRSSLDILIPCVPLKSWAVLHLRALYLSLSARWTPTFFSCSSYLAGRVELRLDLIPSPVEVRFRVTYNI
jgi:hypothetical protein